MNRTLTESRQVMFLMDKMKGVHNSNALNMSRKI